MLSPVREPERKNDGVPLIEGRNVLVARATDAAGNFTVGSVTVVLDTEEDGVVNCETVIRP